MLLAKYGVLIEGLRGERVIRRNATFEIDPLTRRINRFVLSISTALVEGRNDGEILTAGPARLQGLPRGRWQEHPRPVAHDLQRHQPDKNDAVRDPVGIF